jgi:Tfp pilus assembly protein PilN
MSPVRVNLLPEDAKRKDAANRRNGLIAAGFVGLAAVIGGVYFWQLQRVEDAQAVVDEEDAVLTALQADLASLEEFEQLRALRDQGDEVLRSALGGEASPAGVLQDVAAVMPPDAQLDSLAISVTGRTAGQLGDQRDSWATVSISGQTRQGHAPGVERFLLEFDKIAAFTDLYFSNSTVDERGVATFTAEIDLGPEILTGRYVDGLPEELQ